MTAELGEILRTDYRSVHGPRRARSPHRPHDAVRARWTEDAATSTLIPSEREKCSPRPSATRAILLRMVREQTFDE